MITVILGILLIVTGSTLAVTDKGTEGYLNLPTLKGIAGIAILFAGIVVEIVKLIDWLVSLI